MAAQLLKNHHKTEIWVEFFNFFLGIFFSNRNKFYNTKYIVPTFCLTLLLKYNFIDFYYQNLTIIYLIKFSVAVMRVVKQLLYMFSCNWIYWPF